MVVWHWCCGWSLEAGNVVVRSLEFGKDSMPALTLVITDPIERLLVEQALVFARELQTTATNSPDGQVLHNAEVCCLIKGREFLRNALTTVTQAQADAVEKKGHPPAFARAGLAATTKVATTNKS